MPLHDSNLSRNIQGIALYTINIIIAILRSKSATYSSYERFHNYDKYFALI